jgi:hypothetical protein
MSTSAVRWLGECREQRGGLVRAQPESGHGCACVLRAQLRVEHAGARAEHGRRVRTRQARGALTLRSVQQPLLQAQLLPGGVPLGAGVLGLDVPVDRVGDRVPARMDLQGY